LKGNYNDVDQIIVEKNLLNMVVNIFFKYPWNNILHTNVHKIISNILNYHPNLSVELLTKINFLDRLIDGSSQSGTGFQGFITMISSSITEASQKNTNIKEIVDQNTKWQEYINQIHNPRLQNQKFILAPTRGFTPPISFLPSYGEIEDDDSGDSSSSSGDLIDDWVGLEDLTPTANVNTTSNKAEKEDSIQELLNSINNTINDLNNESSSSSTEENSDDLDTDLFV